MENTMAPNPTDPVPPIAWWRVPHMWMVVGGPAVVVVASIVTAVIAVKYQDPVLNKADYERDLKAAHALEGKAREAALFNMLPAGQGRNHATTQIAPSGK
jgi:hypothetical protein